MMDSNLIISMFFISIGILFLPFFAKSLKIPVSVAEMIYGIILGRSFLGWVKPSEWISFLSSFGFLLLMFMAGLGIEITKVNKLDLRERIAVVLVPILSFLLSFWIGSLLQLNGAVSIAIGSISAGIAIPILREQNIKNKDKRIILLTSIVGEFISIGIITAYFIVKRFGFGSEAVLAIAEIVLYALAAILTLRFLKSFVWWYPNKFRYFFEKSPSEIGVRISLAVMFMLSIGASIVHLEPIIGSFIAGIIFSLVFRNTEAIEEKLSGIAFGFLIPIFFMYVGITFKMPNLNLHLIYLLLLLTGMSIIVKIVSSSSLLLCGLTLKQATTAAFLFGAPLTLMIVVAEVGAKLNIVDESTKNVLILLSLATGVIFPILFRFGGRTFEDNDT